jgi:ribbon-helix-helix CopG family protein
MSTRLQVILSDEDAASLKEMAAREGVTVSEWVRRSLREASRRQTSGRAEERLSAIRVAAGYTFPTGDIESILQEIERGYVE